MDICFIQSDKQTHLRASSIHGILWLQTHFESSQWDAIASDQVILNKCNAQMLANDAKEAGLIINYVPSVEYSKKS